MNKRLISVSISVLLTGYLQANSVFGADSSCTPKFLSVPSAAEPGQKVTVSIQTLPGAHCKIEAQEESMTQAFALKPIDADKLGKAAWTFVVNQNYKADKLPVIVTTSTGNGEEKKLLRQLR